MDDTPTPEDISKAFRNDAFWQRQQAEIARERAERIAKQVWEQTVNGLGKQIYERIHELEAKPEPLGRYFEEPLRYYRPINDPEPPRYFQQALDEAVEAIIQAGSQMPLDPSWHIRQGQVWELPALDEEEEQP